MSVNLTAKKRYMTNVDEATIHWMCRKRKAHSLAFLRSRSHCHSQGLPNLFYKDEPSTALRSRSQYAASCLGTSWNNRPKTHKISVVRAATTEQSKCPLKEKQDKPRWDHKGRDTRRPSCCTPPPWQCPYVTHNLNLEEQSAPVIHVNWQSRVSYKKLYSGRPSLSRGTWKSCSSCD